MAHLDALVVRLTDGAWGTELQRRGLAIRDCPDAWNLTHPEQVEAVAKAYVNAGSDIILTNTFGANRIRLSHARLEHEVMSINREGVAISRRAAQGCARVFASMGPTGKLLPEGEVTPKDLQPAFEEQAQALASSGADGLVIETMTYLEEARCAVRAACSTGLPVIACMVFNSGPAKDCTLTGVTPEQAAEELLESGANVIGANCGHGIAGLVDICRRLRAVTHQPIWIKASAGLPEFVDGRAVYRITPAEFASYLPAMIEAGAQFIGGCCGVGPEFIAAARRRITPLP